MSIKNSKHLLSNIENTKIKRKFQVSTDNSFRVTTKLENRYICQLMGEYPMFNFKC